MTDHIPDAGKMVPARCEPPEHLRGVDFGRDEGTVVGVPWSEWNTWIERMYARRIGPFQGPAGPFYAVLRGEGE